MSVRDMLKSIVVSSANDAAVAMAEHMRGSEKAFVADMNARAAELGMENTNFNNCTGLFDDDGHYTTAMDVALMARELIKHDMVKEYTTIWMDSVRGGEFGLTNTNRLVSRYDGCTGLKTGFTSRAGHCLAATAERGGAEYIAVVMNCQSSDDRFNSASQLLDYAFANYTLVPMRPDEAIPPVVVRVGETGSLQPQTEGAASVLVKKDDAGAVEFELTLPPAVEAPVEQGQTLGTLRAKINGEVIAEARLTAGEAVARRSPADIFRELFGLLYG